MRYILKKLFLCLLVSILIFGIVRLIPVSPVEMLLQHYNLPVTVENKEMLMREYSLDKNIVMQYFKWLINLLKGDFGKSYITKLSVRDEIIRRLPYSVVIGLGSLLISMILAFVFGYLSSLKENGIFDKITRGISLVSLSVPHFIWVIFIIYYLGVKIRVIKFFSGNNFWGMFFSILILTFYQVGNTSRVVKDRFLQLKKESYVKFYVMRGFSESYVLLRHCYKPALYSLLSTSIAKFSSVIGGSTVLEFAFAIPGVSYYLIGSIIARDYNVIQAYILIVFIWMLIVHIIFDFLLMLLKEKRSR